MKIIQFIKHPIKEYYWELITIFILLGVIVVMLVSCGNSGKNRTQYLEAIETDKQELYQVWQKVHPATPLTYHEWDILRNNNLLPK